MPRDDREVPVDVDDLKRYVTRSIVQGWRVSLGGRVVAFTRDTARVVGELAARYMDTALGYRAEQPVGDAPVIFPGGDGYGLYHDLAPDDPGVFLAGDAEQRGFWETGGVVDPTTPGHTYGSAVFLPGGRVSSSTPGQATPAPNAAGECLLGARDGTAGLRLRRARPDAVPPELGTAIVESSGAPGTVRLGSADSAEPPALATPLQANFAALNSAIQAWVPVPNDGGASLKPVILAWFNALQPMADPVVRMPGLGP